jgi:hypothetical protein
MKPELLIQARLEACYLENLTPFLEMFDSLLQKNKYHHALVFHLDETSCQVKTKRKEHRVVPLGKKNLFMLGVPPILHLTMLFIVTAEGYHLPSHLLVPHHLIWILFFLGLLNYPNFTKPPRDG